MRRDAHWGETRINLAFIQKKIIFNKNEFITAENNGTY